MVRISARTSSCDKMSRLKDMVPFYQNAGWALDNDASLSKPGDMVVMTRSVM